MVLCLPDTIHLVVDPHRDTELINLGRADRVDVLLACGHYANVNTRSSVWDFPEEGTYCEQCSDTIPFHDRVIAELERAWQAESTLSEPGVLYMISDTGPNFMPTGLLNGRKVELTYALSGLGDWRYVDPPRGYVDRRDVKEQRLAR